MIEVSNNDFDKIIKKILPDSSVVSYVLLNPDSLIESTHSLPGNPNYSCGLGIRHIDYFRYSVKLFFVDKEHESSFVMRFL